MSRRTGIALAAGAVAFALLTTAIGAESGAPSRFLAADLITGLSFVAAGLAAVLLRPGSPVGPALLACAPLWYVGSYAPTFRPVLSHLGYTWEGYYDLVIAGLLLILSSHRHRLEPRLVVAALGGAMLVRSLGRLLLLDPGHPSFSCDGCPANPFAVWPEPGVFTVVETAGSAAMAVAFVVVAGLVFRRLAGGTAVARRARGPILVAGVAGMGAAAFRALDYAWSTTTGQPLVELSEPWAEVFEWSLFGARTLVPIAFLAATLRSRTVAGPIGRFAAGLESPEPAGSLQDALRTALGDPSIALLRPSAAGWVDEGGAAATVPDAAGDRHVTLVGAPDAPVAAVVHDPALADQPELLAAVLQVLRLALDNQRLETQLREQLEAVTESRERIVAATEEERRRIERDLHDGAQQRLVSVMLALQQARAGAEAVGAPGSLRDDLATAATEASEAVRELRELARGIHPAILEDEGLPAAVHALARRAGIRVEVELRLDGRLPRLVESTAYFTVAEALTNTQRHARASHATVRLDHAGPVLEVEVADDGKGGAEPARGTGLRGLADRIAALGGTFEVDSGPARGTRVRATIPAA